MKIEKITAAGLNAIQFAKEKDVCVSITLVDEGGHIIYQARMDDANYMTNEVAYLKAKTAFLFKCPSHFLRSITDKVPVLLQTIQQVPGDVCMLEGGLPLKENERVIGGIGVSGGDLQQDLSVATAFVEFLNELNNGN